MAGPASTTIVYRVRVAGSNTNGGCVDSALVVTDYSQQDAAQLSLTDIAVSGTALTSATGGFTAAMVGNGIWLTGGGATAGTYIITARSSTNAVTLDRTPGTVTSGNGKVGGAWADLKTNSGQYNPGHTVYVRGAGSQWPQAAADYTGTGYITVNGSTSGFISFIGENGRPNVRNDGMMFYSSSYLRFDGIYFSVNGTNYGNLGVLSGNQINVNNCVGDLGANSMTFCGGSGTASGCEIFGAGSTGSSFSNPMINAGQYGMKIIGCLLRDSRATIGINLSWTGKARNNVIVNIKGDGIYSTSELSNFQKDVSSNSVFGCGGNGITFADTSAFLETSVSGNIFANSGAYGMSVASGTTAANNSVRNFTDYNVLYNNTSGNYNAFSAGAHDTVANPAFTNSSGGSNTSQGGGYNFTPGAAMIGAGYPSPAAFVPNYQTAGAITAVASGAGGAITIFRGSR